jgi:type III restriction enzyme
VVARNGQAQALYLVVETKGYDNRSAIPDPERWKMQSAAHFFRALRQRGMDVHFKTKINNESLADLVLTIDPSLTSTPP